MLLIFPPVAKPCEPPAGIAKLSSALAAHGIACTVLDLNLEGLLFLLQHPHTASDTWSRRAVRNVSKNIASLRDPTTYQSLDRYSRAVTDMNKVLSLAGRTLGWSVGLTDIQHEHRSPLRSADLLAAAEHPEQDPFYPYFRTRLLEAVEQQGRAMVGFSLNYLNQALCSFAMIGLLRKEFPGVKIVLGGGLVSSWMKRPGWRDPFGGLVDHLIAGPGEGPLLDLLGTGDAQARRFAPDYSGLPLSEYLSPGTILPYSASSGCFWNKCSFCPEPAEGNLYIPVPPREAAADLRRLVREMKPSLIHLLDNSISPALMAALADDPAGAPWYGFARIGKELLDIEFCRSLERSGCRMLKLGLESGDQGVLDRMEKGIDLAEASIALRNLRNAGIAAYVYLLFGSPSEAEAEARRTLEFTAGHADAISFLNLALFNMPVGAREAERYGTEPFYEGDLPLYTGFRHPRGWDRKAVRRFLDGEFRRHPAIASILRNDPPYFTSNHAAFFARP